MQPPTTFLTTFVCTCLNSCISYFCAASIHTFPYNINFFCRLCHQRIPSRHDEKGGDGMSISASSVTLAAWSSSPVKPNTGARKAGVRRSDYQLGVPRQSGPSDGQGTGDRSRFPLFSRVIGSPWLGVFAVIREMPKLCPQPWQCRCRDLRVLVGEMVVLEQKGHLWGSPFGLRCVVPWDFCGVSLV